MYINDKPSNKIDVLIHSRYVDIQFAWLVHVVWCGMVCLHLKLQFRSRPPSAQKNCPFTWISSQNHNLIFVRVNFTPNMEIYQISVKNNISSLDVINECYNYRLSLYVDISFDHNFFFVFNFSETQSEPWMFIMVLYHCHSLTNIKMKHLMKRICCQHRAKTRRMMQCGNRRARRRIRNENSHERNFMVHDLLFSDIYRNIATNATFISSSQLELWWHFGAQNV